MSKILVEKVLSKQLLDANLLVREELHKIVEQKLLEKKKQINARLYSEQVVKAAAPPSNPLPSEDESSTSATVRKFRERHNLSSKEQPGDAIGPSLKGVDGENIARAIRGQRLKEAKQLYGKSRGGPSSGGTAAIKDMTRDLHAKAASFPFGGFPAKKKDDADDKKDDKKKSD